MYKYSEFDQIDREYFDVINTTLYNIALKSKNTGHTWNINCENLTWGKRKLVVYHKHNDNDSFHLQRHMSPKSVAHAQKLIKEHDEWYLVQKKN